MSAQRCDGPPPIERILIEVPISESNLYRMRLLAGGANTTPDRVAAMALSAGLDAVDSKIRARTLEPLPFKK